MAGNTPNTRANCHTAQAIIKPPMQNIKKVATGKFAADMQVTLQNDGPVTIILEKE